MFAGDLDDYELENQLAGSGDPEYSSRIDAQRVTWEISSKSARKLDAGRRPISDAPLFGGPAQKGLFE